MDKAQRNKLIKSLQPVKYVALFAVLLMSFHYLYIYWSGALGFYPFATQVDQLFDWASLLLFNQSQWVLQNIFHIQYYVTEADQTIHLQANDGQWVYIMVSPGCTSLKQWMHWIFLMLLFPGPWKHKLWYIPLGLIIIEWVNVIRIVGLALLLKPWPLQFDFLHDYIFKTFFYFMIFLMWVIWVEVFVLKKKAGKNRRVGDERNESLRD